MTILMLTGVSILIILSILGAAGILDSEGRVTDYIVDYIADTAACAFIWEAVSVVFLYPSEFAVRYKSVFKKINDFTFIDSKGNELYALRRKEYVKDWIDESKQKKIARICLLISSCIFISIGLIELVNVIFNGKTILDLDSAIATIIFISLTVLSIANILIGSTCILRYLEIVTRTILSNILAGILLLSNLMSLGLTIYCHASGVEVQKSLYVTAFIVFAALFIYFFGMIKTREKNNNTI